MTLTLVLLGAGVTCALLGPWLLRSMRWQVVHPARALRVWMVTFCAGCSSLVMSVGAAAAAAVSQSDHRHGSWLAVTATVVVAWVMLGGVGAAISLVDSRAQPVYDGNRLGQMGVTLLLARQEQGSFVVAGHVVHVVNTKALLALSIGGVDPRIVVSSALVDALDAGQLRCVVAHEIAHIEGRHSLLRSIATVARALAPRARCGRDFCVSVNLLTELAADDRAARVCGAGVVASALDRYAALCADPAVGLRAQRLRAASMTPGASPPVRRLPHLARRAH